MSKPFHNETENTKFIGVFTVENIEYEYILYLLPPIGERISSVQRREIIHYFGNRKFKEETKPCLDVDTNTVKEYIDKNETSAFIRVKPVGINNQASGTLQITNHCGGDTDDIWIGDVCRVGNKEGKENPLYALFIFMEQLAVQNMNKTNMKLVVDRKEQNINALKPKYEGFGFTLNRDDNIDVCKEWKYNDHELVMEKINIIPRRDIIDFSFLTEKPKPITTATRKRKWEGGTRTRRKNKTKGKTTKKVKTQRRRYN